MPSLVNKDNRLLLESFLKFAIACASGRPAHIKFNRMRLLNGVLFDVSDEAVVSQNALSSKLLKTLGPVRGHHSHIDPVIWGLAASLAAAGKALPTQAEVDQCLQEIEDVSARAVRLIKPCQNVRLVPPVRKFEVGPVCIVDSSSAISVLQQGFPDFTLSVGGGGTIEQANALSVTLPPFIWDVRLTAAKPVREEEAAWLIDVALSVMRMAVRATDLGRMAPTLGKIEADAIDPSNPDHNRLTVGPGSSYSAGGWTRPSSYEVGMAARRSIQSKSVRAKTSVIFAPPKGSLGERFAQGLGWLTRGRKSKDRPTRLLYFFTAIEALLSDSDKSAPVIQTIARYAAVIISDKNLERASISKKVGNLYGLRSSLVHTGKRGVYDQDSDTIQYIAEILFDNVWCRINLEMEHSQFVHALSKASYGIKLRAGLN